VAVASAAMEPVKASVTIRMRLSSGKRIISGN
jgi:hypothetical protein